MAYTAREVQITGVYTHESKTWSLWLSEVDERGDHVLIAQCLGSDKRLLDQFSQLVRGLMAKSVPLPKTRRLPPFIPKSLSVVFTLLVALVPEPDL